MPERTVTDPITAQHDYVESSNEQLFTVAANAIGDPRLVLDAGSITINNLPGSRARSFIERPVTMERIRSALLEDRPIIAIIGLGGCGKTEIAHQFSKRAIASGEYTYVIWVSGEKGSPPIDLSAILREMSLVTKQVNLSSGKLEERALDAHILMQQHPILLVLNSYDNIHSPTISDWLRETPTGHSKVVITMNHKPSAELLEVTTQIPVPPLDHAQAVEFARLRFADLDITDIDPKDPQLHLLLGACVGNASLFDWALGELRFESIKSVIERFDEIKRNHEAALGDGDPELVDVIRGRILGDNWASLDDASRELLTILAHFPGGERVDTVKSLFNDRGSFRDSLQVLMDKYLVMRQGSSGDIPIYRADHWAATVARSEGRENIEQWRSFMREWLEGIATLTSGIGYYPDQLSRLAVLDDTRIRRNVEFALITAEDLKSNDPLLVQITSNVWYWYWVRGLWSTEPDVNRIRLDAAVRCENWSEAYEAAVKIANIRGKQGDPQAAAVSLMAAEGVLERGYEPTRRQLCHYRHAKALALLADGAWNEAAELWVLNLKHREHMSDPDLNANLRWYAKCLIDMGDDVNYPIAHATLMEAKEHAATLSYRRASVMIELLILEADVRLNGANNDVVRGAVEDLMRRLDQSTDRETLVAGRRLLSDLAQGVDRVLHLLRYAELFDSLGMSTVASQIRGEFNG